MWRLRCSCPSGVSPDLTMDALYAFTDCEVSISPNTCVIIDDKPRFLGVDEILRLSTEKTMHLLKRELEIRQDDLERQVVLRLRWKRSSSRTASTATLRSALPGRA